MNFVSMKCLAITSSGCPSRSYMARKNSGSMRNIMLMAARLIFPVERLMRRNAGTPISAADRKQRSCRFVRLKMIFDLTLDRSLGTGTYAAILFPSLHQCAESTLRARLPVLNSEKHNSTV